uniref:Putative neurotoxin LTDF 09-05 n=1 Tax=Dolomedes fimbriatus TaxID=1432569 RepID=A0A0K1D8E4_9ARAC|nr:putative neurotoxin LTDF 09-05 [Dolomedes fimbriatus]
MKRLAIFFTLSLALMLIISTVTGEGEISLEAAETPREVTWDTPCIDLGQTCVKGESDCQCCRDNAVCSCSWLFRSHCTCQVFDARASYDTCLIKVNCPNRHNWDRGSKTCPKPCESKHCSGK